MKNVTDSFVSLGHWPSAGSFGFNTDILATNLINLSVVLGVLIFFGKGVCASCLHLVIYLIIENRESLILLEIQKNCAKGPSNSWKKPGLAYGKYEIEADEFRVNGYSEIEREKLNLIDSTYNTLEQLENYKNETINFEQQKASNQVRQRVFQQALQGALGTLNSCLNNELHLRTISANIGILAAMKQITD
uniref:ATP synthase CF0 subunit I n=1 Tax=Ageratum conyzoides TaxID=68299 RepID=A0A6B9IWA5_AGECN|nr:ATP synthase CF0 subunit I [Ageratum conyzoides]